MSNTINFETEYGAMQLKYIIEQYWKEQNRKVKCRVMKVNLGGTYMSHNAIYVVRSDIGMTLPPLVKDVGV